MRKQIFGRKFKRDKNERKALFSGLISSMILRGSIKTTEQKAKAIRADLEKLVTKAKKGEIAKRLLQKDLKPSEIDKMINEIAPAFKDRQGGYTRIIRTGRRFNDDASLVMMEWVEKIVKVEKPAEDKKKKTSSKPNKSLVKTGSKQGKESSSSRKASASAKAKTGKSKSK